MRLICFPFAGSSGSYFSSFAKALPDYIEVISIDLPGRASSLKLSPLHSMKGLRLNFSQFISQFRDLSVYFSV